MLPTALLCAAMRRGRIVVLDVAPLVTDVIDLAEVPEAFRALVAAEAAMKQAEARMQLVERGYRAEDVAVARAATRGVQHGQQLARTELRKLAALEAGQGLLGDARASRDIPLLHA